MKSGFITELDFHLRPDSDEIGVLDSPLIYYSELLDHIIEIPPSFQSDGSSVPRWPIIFYHFGGRSPREGWLHDYLYRVDSVPVVPRRTADAVFKEAMIARQKPARVIRDMWAGVRLCGWIFYHKKKVGDSL